MQVKKLPCGVSTPSLAQGWQVTSCLSVARERRVGPLWLPDVSILVKVLTAIILHLIQRFESKVTSSRNDYSSSGFAGIWLYLSPFSTWPSSHHHLLSQSSSPAALNPQCCLLAGTENPETQHPFQYFEMKCMCVSEVPILSQVFQSCRILCTFSSHHAVAHTSKPVYSVPSLECFLWPVSFGQL